MATITIQGALLIKRHTKCNTVYEYLNVFIPLLGITIITTTTMIMLLVTLIVMVMKVD